MAVRDTGAEQLIKDTAKRVFFAEGKLNATTQDIADAAGVTRTLVNYYFRSKDILFKQVFEEAMQDTGARMDKVLLSDLPFRKKVEKFIEEFYDEMRTYPYKETFMISEINSNNYHVPQKERSVVLADFLKEVQVHMDNGTLKKTKPANFLINLMALMAYPLLTRTLFTWLLDVTDEQYIKLLNERKKMIIDILFN